MNRSIIVYALLHPVNLAVLALALAAGACAAWWMLPVGVAFWLLMVVITIRDPRLAMILLPKSRKPVAQRFQGLFDRIEKDRISVFNSLANAKPSVRHALAPAQRRLDSLVGQAYQVFQQLSALENNQLVNQLNTRSDHSLAETEQKLATTTDPKVKHDLEDVHDAMEKRQAQLTTISTLLSRADAQFASLATSVDGIVTGFISLQSVQVGQIKQELPKLINRIETEMDDLSKFAREVSSETSVL